VRELDLTLARKTQEYRRLVESRGKLESESLNVSVISDRSNSSSNSEKDSLSGGKSTYSRSGSAKKTFVTSGKTRFSKNLPATNSVSKQSSKEDPTIKSVNIYKPNIAVGKKRGLSSVSKRSKIQTNTENSKELLDEKEEEKLLAIMPNDDTKNNENPLDLTSKLTLEEQKRINQLMLECADSPKKEEKMPENEPSKMSIVPVTPKSLINEDAISRIDEIDENLRQLVPIDKWELWSLKTSIRSIATESLMGGSAPSKVLNESKQTLDSLAVKSNDKFKNLKPGDKYLRKQAEERELKDQLKTLDTKLMEIQRENMRPKTENSVITDADRLVFF